MADQVAVFPEHPQHIQTLTWGDTQVRVRFTWRQRTAAWYMDVFEPADGTVPGAIFGDPIVTGRRISPRWAPMIGLSVEGLPLIGEVLAVVDAPVGGDPYLRSDFGDLVRLLLVPESEIPAAADPATASLTATMA